MITPDEYAVPMPSEGACLRNCHGSVWQHTNDQRSRTMSMPVSLGSGGTPPRPPSPPSAARSASTSQAGRWTLALDDRTATVVCLRAQHPRRLLLRNSPARGRTPSPRNVVARVLAGGAKWGRPHGFARRRMPSRPMNDARRRSVASRDRRASLFRDEWRTVTSFVPRGGATFRPANFVCSKKTERRAERSAPRRARGHFINDATLVAESSRETPHRPSSSSPIAAAASRETCSMGSAHRSAENDRPHIRYSTFPSGRARGGGALDRCDGLRGAEPYGLRRRRPAPPANTHPCRHAVTFGSMERSRADASSHRSRKRSFRLGSAQSS